MRALIPGGAGFIGCNAAQRLIQAGWDVVIWDNLSRRGGDKNLEWLRASGPFSFCRVDLREEQQVCSHYQGNHFDLVLHCAGQVAVTTSVANPREDFECNAMGSFNLLEAIRAYDRDAMMIFASTNKVYGNMQDIDVVERNGRYEYASLPMGIPEAHPLDFHSPYGCSKGAADQYVRDYARIYGLASVVFRMSCIAGPRQFGTEDQGWVAHFLHRALAGGPLVIFGDGRQLRDVLYVDDLLRAFELARAQRDTTRGEIYNLGGGAENTISLLELIERIERMTRRRVDYVFDQQ